MLQEDAEKLLAWYKAEQRDLPWRKSNDPYAVAVSELMLQQTTVAAVKPKYRAWLERFPSAAVLADASLEDVMEAWSGLGYYQRARRLQEAAQSVQAQGSFPTTYEGLLQLPGFGPYTAAAVASICFERPELAIDTNVIRVLYRYYAQPKEAQDKATHRLLKERMNSIFQWAHPGDLNQSLMELGASHCSIAEPGCLLCPLKKGCQGRRAEGGATQFPLPKKKKQPKRTKGKVLLPVSEDGARVLLVKGTSLGLLRDLFQPPMALQGQPPEHPISQFSEELSQREGAEESWVVNYGISGRRLELFGRSVRSEPEPSIYDNIEVRWVDWRSCLDSAGRSVVPVSSLTRKVLEKWRENL